MAAVAEVMRQTPPELWESVLPGEDPYEFCARVDARHDIADHLLDELSDVVGKTGGRIRPLPSLYDHELGTAA